MDEKALLEWKEAHADVYSKYNWVEAVYNAIVSEDNSGNLDVSDAQIRRGRKYATGIKLRLLLLTMAW